MKKIAGIWLYYLVGSILISCSTGQQAEEKVVYLKDYLVGYQEGQDATLALRRALDECKKVKARRLELPAEKLYFQPDYAVEQYVFVSNNDEGLKRFAFDLTGLSDIVLEGNGAVLLFSGFVCPFLIREAENIEVRIIPVHFILREK